MLFEVRAQILSSWLAISWDGNNGSVHIMSYVYPVSINLMFVVNP